MEVSKQFHFCYGHRVYNQSLDDTLSCQGACKCRHLHGHNGVVELVLSSESNDDMVLDFNNFKLFEKKLDTIFDHRFVISLKDPYLPILLPNHHNKLLESIQSICGGFFEIKNPEDEYVESFVFMERCPTSENLCRQIYQVALDVFGYPRERNFKIKTIYFSETPKTKCKLDIEV